MTGVGLEMMDIRMRHPALIQPEETEIGDRNDVSEDREAPQNKFKLFRGRQIQMMSLSMYIYLAKVEFYAEQQAHL